MIESITIHKINRWSLNEYEGELSITLKEQPFEVYALIPEGNQGWSKIQVGSTHDIELRLERSSRPPQILFKDKSISIKQIESSTHEIKGLVTSIPKVEGLPLSDILVVDVGFPLLVDLDHQKPSTGPIKVGDWINMVGVLKVDFDVSDPFFSI